MHTQTSRLVRGGVLLVALVISLSMFVSSTDHAKVQAEAQIDISGDWTFTVSNGLTCTATVTQAGTDVSWPMDCGVDFPGTFSLSGTIDTATGDFSLSGTFVGPNGIAQPFDSTGTASPDGNSMSGSWTGFNESGTFEGVRQSASPPAVTVATPAAAVAAALPETGSGGYVDQSSSGLPMVAWLALAGASLAVLCLGVGLWTRRARR
jgi:hypothetical protein